MPRLLYTTFLVLAQWTATAQFKPSILLTHISEENGLSDNHVTCVLKDRQSFIWIGTDNGLNRMDGSTITVYKHKNGDSTSLADNHITILREDEEANIWIGTTSGISRYDKRTNTFFNFSIVRNRYGGATNIVTGLAFDKQNMWIATDGGLVQMNRATHRQTTILCGEMEPLARRRFCNRITSIARDNRGILWLGTYESLWSYEPTTHVFTKEIIPANDSHFEPLITAVADDEGQLWLGTWDTGLKRLNKQTKSVITYGQNARGATAIVPFHQPGGRACLLLNGTFSCFDKTEQKFEKLSEAGNGGMPESSVIYTSADGWIWYGTSNGLYGYMPQRQTFRTMVSGKIITTQDVLLKTANDRIVIGAGRSNILKTYSGSLSADVDYSPVVLKNAAVPSAEALSFALENEDSWWLGTSEGIVHIGPGSGQSQWYRHNEEDSTSLPRNFVTCLLLDHAQTMWVFPWRQGVWQLDRATGKFRMLLDGLTATAGIKKKLVVADAAEDTAGNLWMADMDEGIILYERATGKFSRPFTQTIGPASQTLRIRRKGAWLYSVSNNLFIKWQNKEHCIAIPFPEEIAKGAFDYAADKEGNWWFTTKNGLVYYNETQNTFKRFTTADGLYTNDMAVSLLCKPDGEMLIAAPDFFTLFYPDKLLASIPVAPAAVLTGFSANGMPVPVQPVIPADLAYDQNNIVVNWALPDYSSPFKNQYYCRLQGIDTAWRYVGNKGEVQYASLAPGKYILLLNATDANGNAAPHIIQLAFTIRQPFWKTGWFLGCVVLLVAATTGFFVRRYVRQIRQKAAIERQMAALEMKALRAQMNPHFIFNSLSSIQECIVMNDTNAAYTYLGKFSKLVRSILENSSKPFVSLKEETEMLHWYVQLEQLRFQKPVLFSLTIDEKIDAANTCLPGMIVQPYVENALWHGLVKKPGEKKLQVTFVRKKDMLECTVEDNGVGRNSKADTPQPGKKSMGMQITRERLATLHKQAKVETIDLLDANGLPAGTRIVIHLPIQ